MGEPDPYEQALVDRIVALRAAGWSYQRIGRRLGGEGFRPRAAACCQPDVLRFVAERSTR
jgi:hypothetical protein